MENNELNKVTYIEGIEKNKNMTNISIFDCIIKKILQYSICKY